MTGGATNQPINQGKLNQIMLIEQQHWGVGSGEWGDMKSIFSRVQRYTGPFLVIFHSVWEGVNREQLYISLLSLVILRVLINYSDKLTKKSLAHFK